MCVTATCSADSAEWGHENAPSVGGNHMRIYGGLLSASSLLLPSCFFFLLFFAFAFALVVDELSVPAALV